MKTLILFLFLAPACTVGRAQQADTVLGVNSFSPANFNTYWAYQYPWGPNHNGSARMFPANVKVVNASEIQLTANKIAGNEGNSTSSPYLAIHYHSGTIHSKLQVTVSDNFPKWVISGQFMPPTAFGTWPAFWLTAVTGWPPEIDQLEIKGTPQIWQNTFAPDKTCATILTPMPLAATTWHTYGVTVSKFNERDCTVQYSIDGKVTATHTGVNYMNVPLWLIIDLQMEGSGGAPGPAAPVDFYGKNITVVKYSQLN